MVNKHPARRHKRLLPVIATGLLVLILLTIVGGVAFLGFNWFKGDLSRSGVVSAGEEKGEPSENVDYAFGQLLPIWVGEERITVLLLGVDERSQETGPWRTDTIILLTLDPQTKQAGVLSIPRDLWVPIPGYGDRRINAAHFLGGLYDHPGGGPALAVETIEYNLGVPVDYYIRVNFEAFVTFVDQIGGVDIYVEKVIDDPTYPDHHYGYDPLYIEQGWHHFNGEMALKYARTRHGSSDFDRAHRQQKVMMAILDRLTSYEMLPDLARGAPELYDTLKRSVETDLALDQILALANIAVSVDQETIRFGVIDQSCTQSWVTPEGGQVLVPLRDKMRGVRDYVFRSEPTIEAPEEKTPEVLPTPTVEIATVAVLNGTERSGLAGNTATYLEQEGIDVVQVANADRQNYASTLVIAYHDKPATLSRILKSLDLVPTVVVKRSDPAVDYDIAIVLGDDYEGPPDR
jgi:polyisoprenyl-teichoic acid--peptidoglycan teichoic acid transferase